MRLICWLLGGHWYGEWRGLDIANWTMNGDPQTRYCRRCWHIDYNTDAQILVAIAWGAPEGEQP